MTLMDKLTAMKQADLVALCEKWGVKVHATRGKLKEKRMPVQERLIAAGWPDEKVENTDVAEDSVVEINDTPSTQNTVETNTQNMDEVLNMSDTSNKTELLDKLANISDIYPELRAVLVPEDDWEFGDLYDIIKGDKFVASILPCADEVIVTLPEVKSIQYDKIEEWFENVLAVV